MKNLHVTLVAPPANYLAGLYGFPTKKSYRNQPPLGIGCIASLLRREGFCVTLLDTAALGLGIKRAVHEILATTPDVVGITAITFEAPSACALIKEIKKQSKATVILGGAHANSYYPEIPEQCPEVDAIVAGDGEVIMTEACQRLRDGLSLDGVQGLIFKREDGSFSSFEERPPILDLDSLPSPAYELYPHHLYRPLPHRAKRLPASCMITSRGCAYARCTYCELSGLIRKSYRRYSPERAVEDVITLVQVSKAREIYFQDDIFISEPDWVEEFCDRLSKSGLDILWSCESRFQGVSKDLLLRMRKAGCWRIYYGFESGNQALLDRIEKGVTLEEARKASKQANEAGLDVVGFFMLGLPGESPKEAEETIAFSLELGLDHAIYSLRVPHKNTELYQICDNEGTFVEGNEYYYKKASFVPKAYQSVRQLEAYRNRAFRRFYFRPSFWWRCLKRVRTFEDLGYYLRGLVSLFRYLD